MSFLFRLPLFHFDIENPEVLEQHRETILKSIKLSSTVLYQDLKGKPFVELDNKLRIKLRKYLLRGRFRPTPFGMFAGVGLGKWGTEINLHFPIKSEELDFNIEIESSKKIKSTIKPLNTSYRLIPGINKKHGHYQALVYDTKSKSWKGSKLPVNSLFETLIQIMTKQAINSKEFYELLKLQQSGISAEQANLLWEQILDTGFLVPNYGMEFPNTGKDLMIKNHLEIPDKTRQQLQEFVDSSGSLFSQEQSAYLRNFKNWFTNQFDDRYITLQALLSHSDFLSGQFQKHNNLNENDIAPIILGNRTEHPIDLQELFMKNELDSEIYDVQILFRLDSLGNPVIENMVCDRPFVYTGRFNRDPSIQSHTQKISKCIHSEAEVIYAHLALHESANKQHICNVINIFAYEITPFSPRKQNQLGFDELYIGICRNHLQLIHTPTGKQVIPVVLHPLNGEQITHPVLRLLWEAAHQNRHRFLPYQSDTFSNSLFCPQLNWGKICLQSRRWKLTKENVSGITELAKILDERGIPRHILAGHADRELLLNLDNKQDMQILWQELKRSNTLNLSDPAWFPSRIFRSADGTAAYPQFVFQYSRPQHVLKSDGYFNPITEKQKNCLCFTITLTDSEVPEVLERIFHHLEQSEVSIKIPVWFFMIYGKNGETEIRLRLLEIDQLQKNALLTSFSELFSLEGMAWKTADYFPETTKYGKKGLEISHGLFHLESEFMAQKFPKAIDISVSRRCKEDLIVRLYLTIVSHSPNNFQLFEELKIDVKRIPSSTVHTLKSQFKYLDKCEKQLFNFKIYLDIIRTHEYYYAVGKAGILLLLNHLHMMVNRFFPLETQHHERRIKYRLYREMGKQLYSIPRETISSLPQPDALPYS